MFFRSRAGDFSRCVALGAPAVVALTGVALGVLVSEYATRGFEHGLRGEVLASDELELPILPRDLVLDRVEDFRIDLREGSGHVLRFGHVKFSRGAAPGRVTTVPTARSWRRGGRGVRRRIRCSGKSPSTASRDLRPCTLRRG